MNRCGTHPNNPHDQVQVRRSEAAPDQQGLAFHFDKDEALFCASNGTMWSHPELATVTYLSSQGAPTVVFDSSIADDNDATQPVPPHTQTQSETGISAAGPAWTFVSYPRRGKHLAFPGNLLHGCPAELCCRARGTSGPSNQQRGHGHEAPAPPMVNGPDKQSYTRVTVLVNIWRNQPPNALPVLSRELCSSMSQFRLSDVLCKPSSVLNNTQTSDSDKETGHGSDEKLKEQVVTEINSKVAGRLSELSEHRAPLTAVLPFAALLAIGQDRSSAGSVCVWN